MVEGRFGLVEGWPKVVSGWLRLVRGRFVLVEGWLRVVSGWLRVG